MNSLNSQQVELLLTKLDKVKKERAKEDRSNEGSLEKERKSKKHSQFQTNRYPPSIDRYEVITTLGAGTFGRVKLVAAPNKEVLALKQISKSHIINLKQVDHIRL